MNGRLIVRFILSLGMHEGTHFLSFSLTLVTFRLFRVYQDDICHLIKGHDLWKGKDWPALRV